MKAKIETVFSKMLQSDAVVAKIVPDSLSEIMFSFGKRKGTPGAAWIIIVIQKIAKSKCKRNIGQITCQKIQDWRCNLWVTDPRGLLTGRRGGEERALHPTPKSNSVKLKSVSVSVILA